MSVLMTRLVGCAVLACLFLLPCWSQDRSVLQQAVQQIEKQNLEEAEALLRGYVKLQNGDGLAYYLLGVALGGQGKREESSKYLHKALQLDKNLTPALRFLGLNAFEAGDLDEAREYLQSYLEKAPGDEVAHVSFAQVLLARNELSLAVRHFRQAKTLVQEDAGLQLLFGRALLSSDQTEEGTNVLVGIQSPDPEVLFETGVLLASASNYTDAIEKFKLARSGYPEPLALEFNLALSYFRSGDTAAAIGILNETIQHGRADADVYSLLGDAYLREKRYPEARNALQKALALAPTEVRHHVDLLTLYVELDEIDPGLAFANAALDKHPDNYELCALRAELHLRRHQTHLAEADYRRALQISRTTNWLYTGLATLLAFEDDRLEEAKTLLESRLEKFTDYYSFYLYSEVLRQMGLDRSAPYQQRVQRLLEKSVRLNPNFPPARLNLGRIYAGLQDWPNAISQFETAVAADPGDKRPYYELYKIYVRMGVREKAQEMLAFVREINKNESGKTMRENVRERVEALKRARRSGQQY